MQVFKIEDIKGFMEILFLKDVFDKFQVGTLEVKTLVSISIKGNLFRDWLCSEEQEKYCDCEYVPWKLLRPIAFSLIRGKQTPQTLRIQFTHYLNNGDCGGFRIQYDKGELLCISTYTPLNFNLDKSGEKMWDERCSEFLKKNKIVSTHL